MSTYAASTASSSCSKYWESDESDWSDKSDKKKDYDEPIAIAPIHSKLKKKVTYFTINFFPF
jgi:hypothetical protein